VSVETVAGWGLSGTCVHEKGPAMTAKDVITPDDEDQSKQLEPPPDEVPEATRIASLLRDRFGIDR
jgi:hypothetical protein